MIQLVRATVCVVWLWTLSADLVFAQNPDLNLGLVNKSKICCPSAEHSHASEGVSTFISKLFDTQDFPARWECGSWAADLGWLHIVSDLGIFIAYFAIPVVILYFLRQKNELPFPRIGYLFAAFIFACGFGHLIEAMIFWWPVYRFAGLVKLCTAIVSLVTVFALIRLLPAALRLPSAAMLGKKLLESQDRLNFAVDSAKIGIWHLDVYSQTLNCDARTSKILHLDDDANQFSLHNLLTRVAPEDRAWISEAFAKSAKGSSPLNETFRLLGDDNSIHHIHIQGKHNFDKRGVSNQLTGVCQDITDKQLREEAILESEQRYRSSFENIPVGMAHVATDGQWLKVNKSLCDTLGFDPEELLQRGFQAVTHAEDLPTHIDFMRRMLLGELGSYAVENRYQCKNGNYVWVNVTVSLFRRKGDPEYFIFVIDNIDDRKTSENALRVYHEKVEKLSLVASKTRDSIVISDVQGRVEWVNDAFTSLTGYDLDQVKGKVFGNLLAGEMTDAKTTEKILVCFERNEGIATEIINYAANGNWYWVQLKVDPVFDAAGKLTNFIATQIDITERKLNEEGLATAKRLAEEANQAKSAFLASMSHELRTPLHGVIGMTELLADTRLDERQQRFVKACRTSGHTLLTIINDILDFSKIEAGRFELDCHQFELVQLLDDIVETIGLRIQDKDVELVYRVGHSEALYVEGDSNRLRQVLVNLLGNSIKFTRRGKIELLAEPIELSRESALIRFSVKDSGIGIPQEQLSKLFRDFSQVHKSNGREFGGTGLGLSISKNIVEAMGGDIGVNSIENLGSEFWFTVNFRRVQSGIAAQEPVLRKLLRLRVLIVDSINPCSDMLKSFLTSWDMSCDLVSDASEAYRRLSKSIHGFDLVILHRSIPRTFLLAEKIRQDKALSAIRIFLVAGLDDVEDPNLFDAIIRKPIAQSNLYDAITKAFCEQDKGSDPGVLVEDATQSVQSIQSSRTLKILVAEDNETNQLYVREVISRIGWQCQLVNNGSEALAAIESQEFDVVLMDCHMPEMDGFAATHEIRLREARSNGRRHLPIIALTANAIKGDSEKCLAAGMDAYLAKPFNPYELKSKVEALLCFADQYDSQLPESPLPELNKLEPEQPLDESQLLKQCMGNRAFAGSLLQTFVDNCQVRVEEIVSHSRNGDHVAAGTAAHGLKGISGIVGANSLHTLAAQLELDAQEGNLKAIQERIDQLISLSEDCIRNCLDVSKRFLKESSPS